MTNLILTINNVLAAIPSTEESLINELTSEQENARTAAPDIIPSLEEQVCNTIMSHCVHRNIDQLS